MKDAAASLGMQTDEMMMVLSYDLQVTVVPQKSTPRMKAVQVDPEKLRK